MSELTASSDIIEGNEEDCDKVFGIKPIDFYVDHTDGGIDQIAFLYVCS